MHENVVYAASARNTDNRHRSCKWILSKFVSLRLLTDRWHDHTSARRRLLSNSQSNIVIYLSGHGGSGFLKFLDSNEITSKFFANIIDQMWALRRYNKMLVVIDSCKSASMFDHITSPSFIGISSSGHNEDSISYHVDFDIGVHLVDRFTFKLAKFLDKLTEQKMNATIGDILNCCPRTFCSSTVTSFSSMNESLDNVLAMDFFGSQTARRRTQFMKYSEL
ncbi:hypothetical protein ACOME3_005444 [Neoechinorhynchus agilis]